jgi:PadR family transcriptional regulator, regulatory protein AphA
MSTEVRAGPVSYVVLGIVALRGPSTSYDLKRFVQLSVGHFWPFPHTQLYAEPARLAEAGLLEETREETGRRRRYYSITDEGRALLTEWLGEPATSPMEYRDLGLLKLFFSELTGTEEVQALAAEQADAQRRQLAEYEGLLARFSHRPEFERRLLSLKLGTRMARAALEFWEELATEPPGTGHRRNGR